MERRKIIIYVIFLVTLGYGVYFHFLSGDSKTTRRHGTGPATAINAALVLPPLPDSTFRNGENSNDTPLIVQNSRPRNPFLKKTRSHASAPIAAKPVHYAKPIVTAISPGGTDTFVIANGRLLRIGETIGAWTLINAENGRALFSGPGGMIWVKVGD